MRNLIRLVLCGAAAFLGAVPALGQERAAAGSGAFVADALQGCDSDLRYLNQMYGWQVRWPGQWRGLTRAANDEVRAALAYWRDAGAALDADRAALARAGAGRAPATVAARVLAQVQDLRAQLATGPPPLGDDVDAALAAEWRTLFADRIGPAVARFEAFLREDYRPADRSGLGDPRCFRNAVRHFTTLDLSGDQVEAAGRRLLAEAGADLAALYGVPIAELPAVLERLRTQREPGFDSDRLMALTRAAIARAEAAMPRMFSRPSGEPVGVEPIPRQMEASFPAGAYRSTGDGEPAAYVINLSRADERRLMAEVIAFHETLPGHHIRAALDYPEGEFNSGFLEGWAIYSEYLADEMGLFGAPLDRAGMMAKHLWAASRLVVEPGLHLHGWTREQAIAFMREHTALSDAEIALEVDRYIGMPGQSLAYMLGYDRIAAARRYAEQRLGPSFDLRRFHDVVWRTGSRPLEQMYADVVRWADGGGQS